MNATTTSPLKAENADGIAAVPDSFWELVQRYYSELVNQALAITGSLEDAEDVVQESFCEVMRSRDSMPEVRSLAAWLRAINRDNALDRCRGDRRHSQKISLKKIHDPRSTVTTGGFSALESRELVAQAIESLPERLRTVVVLHYWEHRQIEEIAERLNLAPRTIRQALLDAYRRLYLKLQPVVGGKAALHGAETTKDQDVMA